MYCGRKKINIEKKLTPHEILKDCITLHRYHATVPDCLEIEIRRQKGINIDHINARR